MISVWLIGSTSDRLVLQRLKQAFQLQDADTNAIESRLAIQLFSKEESIISQADSSSFTQAPVSPPHLLQPPSLQDWTSPPTKLQTSTELQAPSEFSRSSSEQASLGDLVVEPPSETPYPPETSPLPFDLFTPPSTSPPTDLPPHHQSVYRFRSNQLSKQQSKAVKYLQSIGIYLNNFIIKYQRFLILALTVAVVIRMNVFPHFILMMTIWFMLSVRIVTQGNECIVERFGQYRRTLKPGLNFVFPFIDRLIKFTTREQLLEILEEEAITQDYAVLKLRL